MTELRVRRLIRLARTYAEQGRCEQTRALLVEAGCEAGTSADRADELRGLVHAEHGMLLLRWDRAADAVTELDVAVRLLGSDPGELAAALLHRGVAQLRLHRTRGAATDLDDCLRLAATASPDVRAHPETAELVGLARHHRGYLALLAGDLPVAVRDLAACDEPTPLGATGCPGAVQRARALRAAGLFAAADAELAAAAQATRPRRAPEELAEIELERAEVALLDRRPSDACRWARQAARRWRRTANVPRAALADLLALQAAQELGHPHARIAEEADTLAGQLLAAGLGEDATLARLIGARALVAVGRNDEVTAQVRAALRHHVGIGTRLLARVVGAEAGAHPRTRTAQVRAALDDLHRRRPGWPGLDLRSAITLHGRRLADLGLAAALADGRPAVVLSCSEPARALATAPVPVRPPADPVLADLVAELGAVRNAVRAGPQAGRGHSALRARYAALQRQIRRRGSLARSSAQGGERSVAAPFARLADIRAVLEREPDGGLLVSYLVSEGRLHALVVSTRHAQVVALGSLGRIVDDLHRVRADLDALAAPVLPERLRTVARASLSTGLRRLDSALWWPLADAGEGPVVVVPAGPLAVVPWTSLPGLRNRPVTVAPSATWWLGARNPVPAQGRPLLVAGPAPARAGTEVQLAADAWPTATVLTGDRATPAAVLAAAAYSPLLHVAALGAHEPHSPAFSTLELAGGALYGYDLHGPAVPRHVVLSAHHLAATGSGPGVESLGIAGALLAGGAASVVCGVSRLGDAVACEVLATYHRELRAGHPPAAALASALAAAGADRAADGARPDPAPLVCFGAGW